MENKYYTAERNVQIVISLLKAHGIKKVIASPGTTNMTFVGSIQQDPWFEIYSSVDERSAAYIACGLAEETGEAVVLSCTGATASRNYMSGLTEAYYRKLPVLAITSHRGEHNIGHLIDQQIDRRQIPNDVALLSVTIPMVDSAEDEKLCTIEANKAILELTHNGGGPVHINLYTRYTKDFSVKTLPATRVIRRYNIENSVMPELPKSNIAIFIGSHKVFDHETVSAIEAFCEANNAFVICDHTSGYKGKYKIPMALVIGQKYYRSPFKNINLLIHLGEVSGDAFGRAINPTQVWRVSEDGALRDMFGTLTNVFEMSEIGFFKHYCSEHYTPNVGRYNACLTEYNEILSAIPQLPFGNIWIAQQIHNMLPNGCELHLGILNSLRSWNFFQIDDSIRTNCNVGGFGIDGGLSSLVGASLANPNRLYFGVFGDLAFFYDMNVMGNRHVGNNVRILLVNNGKGNEFRLSMHPCNQFGDDADEFMAAAGHYGNKSKSLVKHFAEDLGYLYLTASNKDEFQKVVERFVDPKINCSIVFEVFTDMNDERDALDQLLMSKKDPKVEMQLKVYDAVQGTLLETMMDKAKKILR